MVVGVGDPKEARGVGARRGYKGVVAEPSGLGDCAESVVSEGDFEARGLVFCGP